MNSTVAVSTVDNYLDDRLITGTYKKMHNWGAKVNEENKFKVTNSKRRNLTFSLMRQTSIFKKWTKGRVNRWSGYSLKLPNAKGPNLRLTAEITSTSLTAITVKRGSFLEDHFENFPVIWKWRIWTLSLNFLTMLNSILNWKMCSQNLHFQQLNFFAYCCIRAC